MTHTLSKWKVNRKSKHPVAWWKYLNINTSIKESLVVILEIKFFGNIYNKLTYKSTWMID